MSGGKGPAAGHHQEGKEKDKKDQQPRRRPGSLRRKRPSTGNMLVLAMATTTASTVRTVGAFAVRGLVASSSSGSLRPSTRVRTPPTTTTNSGASARSFSSSTLSSHRISRSSVGSRSSISGGRWMPSSSLFSTSSEAEATSSEAATLLTTDAGDSDEEDEPGEEGGAKDAHAPFKVNILDLSPEDVEALIISWGEPKYRVKQVLKWLYEKRAMSWDDMNNLPKALREKLALHASIGSLEVAVEQVSKDGTRKRAYRLHDGQLIEAVLMPYADGRKTACISSQAGCALGCVFCATGQMGFVRQLTSTEIFEQAYRFSQELEAKGERLSNIVMMGMGEPLANYNNVLKAVRRINTELGIGARHITISTVGLVPRIYKLAQEDIQVKLAVSLHAANDRERSRLMPVNKRFELAELITACKAYVDQSGRRMTFEWALIHGENDSPRVANELVALLAPLRGMCHVNIIPLNPTKGYRGGPAQSIAMDGFVRVLEEAGIPATPRVRRGIDIDAGCGQLSTKQQALDEAEGEGEAVEGVAPPRKAMTVDQVLAGGVHS